ncbi:MAG: glycosyltransferase family 1 protein [Chloroflexota bacterium]
MKIGIDYTAAVWQGAGIGRYTRELIRAAICQNKNYEYRLFFAAGGLDQQSPYVSDFKHLCREHANVHAIPIPLTPRRMTQFWQRLRAPLPIEIFTGRLDLLYSPDFVLVPTRAPSILTVHDLSFYVYPEFAAQGMVRYLSDAVPRAVRRADLVLADSQATKNDMVRMMNADPARILVVYPGVTDNFRVLTPEECQPVKQKFQLPEQFLVFVGTLSPRKNVVRLLEAFHRLTQQPQHADMHLVLVGQLGWLSDDIFTTITRLNLGQHVLWLDNVDDNDLPAVYNLARVSVYPSLYEGFGIPPLEAMACGTPVVTANNSSLPEAVGDAALMVFAEDVEALASSIAQLLTHKDQWTRLRDAGLKRVRQFTWERAAMQLLDCYARYN